MRQVGEATGRHLKGKASKMGSSEESDQQSQIRKKRVGSEAPYYIKRTHKWPSK